MKGNREGVAHRLLAKGAVTNRANQMGCTPLHYATLYGQKEMVQFLLNRGARPNEADQDGRTPLHYALQGGHSDIAQILTEKGGILLT